jgi:hypothetical protein
MVCRRWEPSAIGEVFFQNQPAHANSMARPAKLFYIVRLSLSNMTRALFES